jgi:hypothetical protein
MAVIIFVIAASFSARNGPSGGAWVRDIATPIAAKMRNAGIDWRNQGEKLLCGVFMFAVIT